MNGNNLCELEFTEPFDTDICGDDGLLEARQVFECYGEHSATNGNVEFVITAPGITD